jgi:hypothetical protein
LNPIATASKYCIDYTVDSVTMLISKMRKKAIVAVLQKHDGLPLDPINTESNNYVFFSKVFDAIRLEIKNILK